MDSIERVFITGHMSHKGIRIRDVVKLSDEKDYRVISMEEVINNGKTKVMYKGNLVGKYVVTSKLFFFEDIIQVMSYDRVTNSYTCPVCLNKKEVFKEIFQVYTQLFGMCESCLKEKDENERVRLFDAEGIPYDSRMKNLLKGE